MGIRNTNEVVVRQKIMVLEKPVCHWMLQFIGNDRFTFTNLQEIRFNKSLKCFTGGHFTEI